MATTDPKLIERVRYTAAAIRVHADKFPVPSHMLANADALDEAAAALSAMPTAAAINEAAHQWQDIANTEWIDGRDVVLFAHGMEVSARYCPGEWSDDTPISPREYSGAVWSCFDDQFQFEIEETSSNPAEWHHGPVTHWREPTPAIEAKESQHGA